MTNYYDVPPPRHFKTLLGRYNSLEQTLNEAQQDLAELRGDYIVAEGAIERRRIERQMNRLKKDCEVMQAEFSQLGSQVEYFEGRLNKLNQQYQSIDIPPFERNFHYDTETYSWEFGSKSGRTEKGNRVPSILEIIDLLLSQTEWLINNHNNPGQIRQLYNGTKPDIVAESIGRKVLQALRALKQFVIEIEADADEAGDLYRRITQLIERMEQEPDEPVDSLQPSSFESNKFSNSCRHEKSIIIEFSCC